MIVDLFIPCYIDNFFPGTAFNMIKVLEKAGCAVHYNSDQTCCGQPAYTEGYMDYCKEIGTKFIRDFENDRYIVAPSPSCVAMIKNYYSEMFHNTVLHNEYKQLRKNIYEFTDFLVNVLHIKNTGAVLEAKATYHDSCVALRELQIKQQPRELLQQVKGLELIEMKDSETCCGMGGSFAARYENFSASLSAQKCANIKATGAQYVISNDYKCLMHLKKELDANNIQIMHIADVLASGI